MMEMDLKLPRLANSALSELAWVKLSAVVDTDWERPNVECSENAAWKIRPCAEVLAVLANPADANRTISLDVLREIAVNRGAAAATITPMRLGKVCAANREVVADLPYVGQRFLVLRLHGPLVIRLLATE
jgi:hypothetical protein